jgi:hypothetical protein
MISAGIGPKIYALAGCAPSGNVPLLDLRQNQIVIFTLCDEQW